MKEYTVAEMVQKLILGERITIVGDNNRKFSIPVDVRNTTSNSISFLSKKLDLSEIQGTVITDRLIDIDQDICTLVITDNPRRFFVRMLNEYFSAESRIYKHDIYNCGGAFDIAEKTRIGKNVRIKPGCVIGEDGFSYERQKGGSLQRFLHYGNVVIGDDVEIGANTTIDGATFGSTIIGNGTKIDNLVHIAHNVVIGDDCLIVANVGIGGGVKIGDRCFIGLGAQIKDGISIGSDCTIGMGAVVLEDVPAGSTVVGNPARKIKQERFAVWREHVRPIATWPGKEKG
ncbi:MAG: DapH/DapD/GlmU-related protein [Sulfuricurvum sp.]|jgi:acetyltransferase-like isoleucine patch superfamily enzyme|nr:DapH/DapD/GlmU-related protein [Sulfuricurvum sp.]